MKKAFAGILLVAGAAALAPPQTAHAAASTKISGTWSAATVTNTTTPGDRSTVIDETGTLNTMSTDGTETGAGTYTNHVVVNNQTNKGRGSISATLTITVEGSVVGDVNLVGRLKVNGITGEVRVNARITGGTGGLEGIRGTVKFTGTVGENSASGDYRGHVVFPPGAIAPEV